MGYISFLAQICAYIWVRNDDYDINMALDCILGK
jgi:hypothetical protein